MSRLHSVLLTLIAAASTAVAVKTFLPAPPTPTAGQQWEYKRLVVEASFDSDLLDAAIENPGTFSLLTDDEDKKFNLSEGELSRLGREGWELTASVPEMETAHPNFGNSGYVTGLQANVRPSRLTLIFKRPADPDGGSE